MGRARAWPRTLLLAAVTAVCLGAGAAFRSRDGAAGRLGGFLWAAAVLGALVAAAVVLTRRAAR